MNKRGNVLIAIVYAVMILFAGFLFINLVRDDVNTAENTDNLDCSNLDNSDGIKLACLGTGMVIPYLILIIISTAGGLVASKFL